MVGGAATRGIERYLLELPVLGGFLEERHGMSVERKGKEGLRDLLGSDDGDDSPRNEAKAEAGSSTAIMFSG